MDPAGSDLDVIEPSGTFRNCRRQVSELTFIRKCSQNLSLLKLIIDPITEAHSRSIQSFVGNLCFDPFTGGIGAENAAGRTV